MKLAEPIAGARSDRLAEAAAAAKVIVVARLPERTRDRICNAVVALDAGGSILLVHRKINELSIGSPPYSVGASSVGRLRSGAWADWLAVGCSLAVDCPGNIVAKGPYGEKAEELVVANVAVRDK